MRKEIIVHAERELTHIAILEEGRLAELYIENPQHERTIGNIYLGRVKKVMPSIKAAFVDVGLGQDAFLHYSDLTDNLPDWIDFLKDPNQTVGERKPTTSRPKNRRRRPSKNRPQGRQGGSSEKAEGEQREGRLGKSAKARGERRSQQRRRGGQQKGGSGSQRSGQKDQPSGPHPSTYLERDQSLLVKITKEPISNKGSRVSTDISLAGRFLVLVPLADYVAVSKKISSYKERRRLKALAKSLAPEGFGVIVRTVAEGKSVRMLDTDLQLLVEKWRRIESKIQKAKRPPALCYEDVSMVSSIMRDLFSEDYDRILVDETKLFRNLQNYVNAIAPDMADAVQQYEGNQPIFQYAKVQRDFDEAFARRVDLPSGGYLFIEHTEAMHVVDVNSGRARHRGASQEENALRVNMESARAIARHLRLRDLGGIIVVDFIDLRDERKRRKVYDELKREFRKDRAVTKLLPMSDFGLIQITRQRIRPSITTTMEAPSDDEVAAKESNARSNARGDSRGSRGDGRGRGSRDNGRSSDRSRSDRDERRPDANPPRDTEPKAEPKPEPRTSRTPKELVDELDAWIGRFRTKKQRGPLHLHVHPFTAAYLTSRVPNQPTRWLMRHFTRVRVKPTPSLDPLGYRFVNPRSGEDLTQTYAQKLLDAAPESEVAAAASSQAKPAATEAPVPTEAKEQGTGESSDGRSRGGQSRRGGRDSARGTRDGEGRGDGRGRNPGDRSRGGSGSQQRRGRRDERRDEVTAEKPEATEETGATDSRGRRGRDDSSAERSGESGRSRRRGRRGGRGRSRNTDTQRSDTQRDESQATDGRDTAKTQRGGRGRSSDAPRSRQDEADSSEKPSASRGRGRGRRQAGDNDAPSDAVTNEATAARGRSRSKAQDDDVKPEVTPEAQAEASSAEEQPKPKRAPRSRSRAKADDAPTTRPEANADADEEQPKPKRAPRSRSRKPKADTDVSAPEAEASGAAPAPKKKRGNATRSAKAESDGPAESADAPEPKAAPRPKPKTAPKPRVSGDRRFMKIDLTSRPGSATTREDDSDA